LRLRDLALVGALVLLGGFALADALRDDGSGRSATAEETTVSRPAPAETEVRTTPFVTDGRTDETSFPPPTETRPEPVEQPRQLFAEVPGAPGDLLFVDDDGCRLRDVSAATGVEFPLPRTETSCELWVPRVGTRAAYGIEGASGDLTPFRLIDVAHPQRDLGTYLRFDDVVWSSDGQRIAWCNSARSGVDLEVRRSARTLDFCPRAYTPDGKLAHTRDRELLVGGRRLLEASRHIEHVSWGRDGSLALVLENGRIERRVGRRVTHAVRLPSELVRLPLELSPDNCAALVMAGYEVYLVNVGCFPGTAPRSFEGVEAAWSPDGKWIAVAELEAIAFHRVIDAYRVVRWDAKARTLAWR
jgi:hypothetical protein